MPTACASRPTHLIVSMAGARAGAARTDATEPKGLRRGVMGGDGGGRRLMAGRAAVRVWPAARASGAKHPRRSGRVAACARRGAHHQVPSPYGAVK